MGNVFEDLIGLKENNKREADYFEFEIKSKQEKSQSMISLFGYSPDSFRSAATSLRENYGKIDEEFNLKILYSTVYHHQWNTVYNKYKFKLDLQEDKLFLRIKDKSNDKLVDENKYYWKVEKIIKLLKKVKNCAFVEGNIDTNKKEVEFNKMTIYKNVNVNRFFFLLKEGVITLDFKIGINKSGKNIGSTHDHGTGFRIKQNKIIELYEIQINPKEAK